jgi:cell division protein FtsZ
LCLFEINEAARLVSEAAHADANIIFGAVIDDTLGDEVRVTVIAAGFDGGHLPTRRDSLAGRRPATPEPAAQPQPRETPVMAGVSAPSLVMPPGVSSADRGGPDRAGADRGGADRGGVDLRNTGSRPRTITFDDADDLDVPDFLK